MQYYDTGWFGALFTVVLIVFILFNISRARAGKNLYIRRIAGLNALDEAIGRATEMGKPVLMVPGIGGLNAISVQALNIFAYVTKTAARFGTPIRLCLADAAVYTVAQEIIRDAYQSEGLIERYDTDSVRFISDRQFAFAAGVSGIIHREQAAATFFLGEFFAESLIFAETANSIGAIQVAGSTQNTQTPFFIAACDYVLIGDEFYAASAYLSREPVLVGSLIGQDWSKILIGLTVLAGVLGNSIQMPNRIEERRFETGLWAPDVEHLRRPNETFFHSLFNPATPIPGEERNDVRPSLQQYLATRAEEVGATSWAKLSDASLGLLLQADQHEFLRGEGLLIDRTKFGRPPVAPPEGAEFGFGVVAGSWYGGPDPEGRILREFVVRDGPLPEAPEDEPAGGSALWSAPGLSGIASALGLPEPGPAAAPAEADYPIRIMRYHEGRLPAEQPEAAGGAE
jgi:hypothetical protein